MEASSHSLDQQRLDGLRFRAAIFTNLTRDHLDYHGTEEAYFQAKARLATYLAPDGLEVVNADDPAWARLPPREPRVTFGDAADVQARDVEIDDQGARFDLVARGSSAPVALPLLGRFNVSNALAVAACALGLGVPLAAVGERLTHAPSVPGRMERIAGRPCTVLRDYAHTPDALARALEAVRGLTRGRVIVVFGAGGDRDRGKRAPMGAIAARLADIADIATSDNPRTEDPERILDEIEAGMGIPHHRVADRREAIALALGKAVPGDVVLLAGEGARDLPARGRRAAAVRRTRRRAGARRLVTGWTADAVAAVLGTPRPAAGSFRRVSTDTRALEPGDLFVALAVARFDGHAFLAEAKARGALGAVVRRGTPEIPALVVFEVDDTLDALGRLARARRRRVAGPVVAVTGSSGKTSTKEMLRAALGTAWRVHATTGNLNNLIGVPLTILEAPEETTALVVEAGASIPGEIARLRSIIEPTIAVVTNVSYAHVAGFGSLAGVLAEKVALTEGVPLAVVGLEPPELAVEARRRAPTIVAGVDRSADVHPDVAALDPEGYARLRWAGSEVTLGVVGLHQVDNAMLARAAARAAGADPARAVGALASVRLPPGRATVVQRGRLTVIDDTYNANPGSLRAALRFAQWLAARRERPLVVVVGSMLELGAESARLHAAAAAEIVDLAPALVAAVGEFATAFGAFAPQLGSRLLTVPDAASLGPPLRAALRGDEVVLLKASRGVGLEVRAAAPQLRGTRVLTCSITSSPPSPRSTSSSISLITSPSARPPPPSRRCSSPSSSDRRSSIPCDATRSARSSAPKARRVIRGSAGRPRWAGSSFCLPRSCRPSCGRAWTAADVDVALVAMLWMGGIGVVDDFLKIVRGKSQGLVARWKLVGQISLGLVLGLFLLLWPLTGTLRAASTQVPLFKYYLLTFWPPLYVVFVTIVLTGTPTRSTSRTGSMAWRAGSPPSRRAVCDLRLPVRALRRGTLSRPVLSTRGGGAHDLLRGPPRSRARISLVQRASGPGLHG